jgi:hypothetical protein
MSVLPAGAAAGENVVLGQKNYSGKNTVIKGNGTTVFYNKDDEPAARFKVTAGAPFTVNSTELVTDLNADLLDGMEAWAFATAGDVHPFVLALAPGYATWPAYTSDLSLEWQCLTDGTAQLIWSHSGSGDWYLGGVQQVASSVAIVSISYGEKVVLGVDVPISSLTAATTSYSAIMLAPGGVFSNGPGYLGATCIGQGVVFTRDTP